MADGRWIAYVEAIRLAAAGQPPDADHDCLTARQTADLLGLSVKWVHAEPRGSGSPRSSTVGGGGCAATMSKV